jgi:hypothetical protein
MITTDEPISAVLVRAKEFKKPPRAESPTRAWITEKRRPRCPNPIPAIPIGKQIRFDWDSVVRWLEECAAADAQSLQQRRTDHVPQRRKA